MLDARKLLKKSKILLGIIRGLRICYRAVILLFFKHLIRPIAIRKYFADHEVRKLQIGAGENLLNGWLNTEFYEPAGDRIFLDAASPFPFPEKSFDYVFSEHVIEHLSREQGLDMLAECFRILKAEGKVRITTPDLRKLMSFYLAETTDAGKKYIDWFIEYFNLPRTSNPQCVIINYYMRAWGHQFLYDRKMLQVAMEKVGFVDVREAIPGQSSDRHLQNLEYHWTISGLENSHFDTMVLEARRPI